MRFHTTERPCQCELCEAVFASKRERMLHTQTQNGEKHLSVLNAQKSFLSVLIWKDTSALILDYGYTNANSVNLPLSVK